MLTYAIGSTLLRECRAVSSSLSHAAALKRSMRALSSHPHPAQRQRLFSNPQLQQRRFKTVLRGSQTSKDPWKVLNVSRDVSDQDLKKAYIKLAKEHHPDKTGGDDTMFKKVKESYDAIRSGEAAEQFPSNDFTPSSASGATRGHNTTGKWANGYGGFAQAPPGYENMSYSSSQTTHTRDGGEETVFTFKDASGSTFTYTEKKHGGDRNFWGAYEQAQNEALKQEAQRMKRRAEDNEQFAKVFNDWANHKVQHTIDYQEYVRARDKAFYRFVVIWFWVFLFFRICINMFA